MSNPFPQGGRVFDLPGQIGQTKPNIHTDLVSLYAEAARIPKTSGWFASDTSIALSFKVVASYTAVGGNLGNAPNTITVTKSYSFDVTRDSSGNVILPLRSLVIVDTCPLMTKGSASASDAFLSDLTMNLTFLSTRDSTGFSIALQEIFKLSSKLPIPNPYTPYVTLLGDGISDVIQSVQSQQANPQPLSNIGFQFLGDRATSSGYTVLLMSTNQQIGNGYVDVDNVDKSHLGYDDAHGLTYNGKSCQNAYVLFRVGYISNSPGGFAALSAPTLPQTPKSGELMASISLAGQRLMAIENKQELL